jgi:hypothetical protein
MENLNSPIEIASHVFIVEFHVYLYHLLDLLPCYDLPKLPGSSHGFTGLPLEDVEVQVATADNSITRNTINLPRRCSDVIDFYLYDTRPAVFFPSYDYHTLSRNGVVLRDAILVVRPFANSQWPTKALFLHELMLNKELESINRVSWKTPRAEYELDLQPRLSVESLLPQLPPSNMRFRDCDAIITSTSVDLRPLCPPILNQGDLGTCGVAAVTSFLEFITRTRLSVLFLYYTTRVYTMNRFPWDDSGTEIPDLLRTLKEYGICSYQKWPYETDKFCVEPPREAFEEAAMFRPSTELKPLNDIDEMKATLRERRIPFFMDVNFAPLFYAAEASRSGRVPLPANFAELDADSCEHTVLVVGYDDSTNEFIFQNSWGPLWGDCGFGYLPYQYITYRPAMYRNAYTWAAEPPTTGLFNN